MVKNQKSQKLKKIIEYAPVWISAIFIMICLIIHSLVLIDFIPAGAKKEIPECELSIRKDDTILLDRIIDIGQDGSLSDEEARVKMLDIALKEYPQED